MTVKEAYQLELKKWKYIIANDGEGDFILDLMPELKNMKSEDPYCDIFLEIDEYTPACHGCPLAIIDDVEFEDGHCTHKDHPWRKWMENKTTENAKKVLNLIYQKRPE